MIRLSNWAMSRDRGPEDEVRTNIWLATLRWIPACLGLAILVYPSSVAHPKAKIADRHIRTSLSSQVFATPSNFGNYQPFLYKVWRYPRDARNRLENSGQTFDTSQGTTSPSEKQPGVEDRKRQVKPNYLCFLGDGDRLDRVMKVSEWTEANGKKKPASYVFVSFTSKHFREDSFNNDFLREVGIHAAKMTKTSAYWVSTSCLCDLDEQDKETRERQKKETVWNMSDIVRGADAIAIAVPGPLNAQFEGTSLDEWGDRVWTMPELLLYTGKLSILIYESVKRLDNYQQKSPDHPVQCSLEPDQHDSVDQQLWTPRELPRRQLWSKVWHDHGQSGQLIDHYEGSLILSRLQLCQVALSCLYKRKTDFYLEGDISYVLMGLLRHRPNVAPSDSGFQAFARLSLANDSDKFLERMICLLPKTLDDEWWSLSDAWNVMLWDIDPTI